MLSALLVAATGSAAGAAQLLQPTPAAPYQVSLDAGSHPAPFTISVAGFAPQQQVFVEQCDGLSPSTPNWDPTIDCDSGSSPAPVAVSSDGRAVFAADDLNHRFTPFVGSSPQDQFSCLPAGAPAGGGGAGMPAYSNCQVRVSTNNATVTPDQVMFSLALPAGATPPPVTTPISTNPNAVTTSTAARGSTKTPAGGHTATSKTKHRRTAPARSARAHGTSTTARRGGGSGGSDSRSGSGDGSSASSVGWVIAGIVAASGAGGYLWAWRRKRLAKRAPTS